MKMKFIPLILLLGLATANSQITTTSGAQVYVSKGTLVYSTGDVTVKSGTTKFLNKGNVKIGKLGDASTGTYKSDSNVGEDIFVLSYDDVDQYGQLIIESGNPATGKLTKQYNLNINNPGGTNVYFGSPFNGYTSANLLSDLTGGNKTSIGDLSQYACIALSCNPRDYVIYPVLEWSNTNLSFDPSPVTENNQIVFEPSKFYLFRKGNHAIFPATIDFTAVKSFTGTPFVSNGGAPEIKFQERTIKIGDNARNAYRVKYYTYLSDPAVPEIASFLASTTEALLKDKGFGDYTYQLTNPYTSNLNLKTLTNNYTNIQAISSFRSITKGGLGKTRYTGQLLIATVAGAGTTAATLVGNSVLEIIPPMTNFEIKGTSGASSIKFDTSTSHKVFDISSYFTDSTKPDPAQETSSRSVSMLSAKSVGNEFSTGYQLNLQLWNSNQDEFISNTFVYASPNLPTGALNEVEALNLDVSSNTTGVYTIPEAVTGGPDPNNSSTKLYINAINTDAVKVAIPLGINVAANDNDVSYTFKADLTEGGKKLSSKSVNFSNPSAKYYIHDKKTGAVTELTQDAKYSVKIEDDKFTTVNKDGSKTVDRYELFWREVGTMGTDDLNSIDGVTNVYKSGNEYKVRFNKNWNKADVTVFNVVGQLISSEKNINAQDDYLLPIQGSSSTMYIIKIVNDKGESVTKKIVK